MTADTFFRRRSSVAWHRSLYGRIAIGYVLLIALVLAAQGGVFLWLVGRSTRVRFPGLTRQVSAELAGKLEADPNLDLEDFAARARPGEHVFVIMKDGRVAGARRPPETTVQDAVNQLHRSHDPGVPTTWENSVYRAVPVDVGGRMVGVLGIVPPTPWERFGPAIAAIGVALLAAGTLVSAVLIFGPVRRRIHHLQSAANRLGAGDFSARAREEGSDEVAELARAFNAMAAELSKRESALDASNRARRQLLADVSHELMTPLTAVLGHLETLMMAEVRLDDDRRLRHLNVAHREAERIERLVGDLLDTARLEAGGGDLDLQAVPIPALFEQVVAHHECDSRARNIRLVPVVDSVDMAVWGDPFRLEQALENVTANALRHTPNDGVVELKAEASGDTVVVTITDSGEGIAAEHLPHIFERFYKASAAQRIASRGSGSGLGLSIVKAIVTRHGGRVSASSVVDRGTTIRIDLPAAKAFERVPADALHL